MSTAITVIPQSSTALMPAMSIQQASERYNMLVEFTKTVMVKDQDFGAIKGVDKPCLYKAGAEKLSSLFGLSPAFVMIERTEDWTGREHNGEPFFYFFYKCQLMRGGEIVGEGDGSCNSWEKKYRYREGKRKCPQCGAEAIIKGKEEYGGGFLCFGKKGGCGAKFKDKDQSIIGQDVGTVVNPDIAEVVNTIQKMAQKRALVAAVLIACNASAFYTQDVEDMRTIDVEYEEVPSHADRVKAAKAAQQTIVDAALKKEAQDFDPNHSVPHFPAEPLATTESIAARRAALEKEAVDALEPHTVKHPPRTEETLKGIGEAREATKPRKATAPPAVSFDMLESFSAIKKEIVAETGNDRLYYEVLKQHNFAKSNLIPDRPTAVKVYKDLGKALTEARKHKANCAELREIGTKCSVDGEKLERFWRIMGNRSFSAIDEAEGQPDVLPALLEELREVVK